MKTNKVPDALAGYQQVVVGLIQEGDLVTDEVSPCAGRTATKAISLVGESVEEARAHGINVYRKLPLPSHRELDNSKLAEALARSVSPVRYGGYSAGGGGGGCGSGPAGSPRPDGSGTCAPVEAGPPLCDVGGSGGCGGTGMRSPEQPIAKTYDDGKPPLSLLPPALLKEVALVQAYGQNKYGDTDNYRKGMQVRRQLSCALRHIHEYLDGHDLDAESGRPHLAHAACRLGFVLQNIADGVLIDDRYKRPSNHGLGS